MYKLNRLIFQEISTIDREAIKNIVSANNNVVPKLNLSNINKDKYANFEIKELNPKDNLYFKHKHNLLDLTSLSYDIRSFNRKEQSVKSEISFSNKQNKTFFTKDSSIIDLNRNMYRIFDDGNKQL